MGACRAIGSDPLDLWAAKDFSEPPYLVAAGKPDIKIRKPREHTADNALCVSSAISWYQTWATDMPKSLWWLEPYVSYAPLQKSLMLLEI